MKVQMGPRRLLELVKVGIQNGNYEAAIDIIDDAIAQLPPDDLPSAPQANDADVILGRVQTTDGR